MKLTNKGWLWYATIKKLLNRYSARLPLEAIVRSYLSMLTSQIEDSLLNQRQLVKVKISKAAYQSLHVKIS